MPHPHTLCLAASLFGETDAGLPGKVQGLVPSPRRAPTPANLADCDRAISRRVRKEVETQIYKRVSKEISRNYSYPMSCPLSTENDMLLELEQGKKRRYKGKQDGEYECTICGKKFKNEHYMDLHMLRVHSEVAKGSTCFADFCFMFRSCEKRPSRRPLKSSSCNETTAAQARIQCEEMVMKCFPVSGNGRQFGSDLRRSLCGMLDCDAMELKDQDTKHNQQLELVVLVVLFLFVIIICLLILLVCFENGDDFIIWVAGLEVSGMFGGYLQGLSKSLLRFRNKAQKETGVKKTQHRSI
jgi:hypothetical protein